MSEGGNSLYNTHEVELVLLLCGKLWKMYHLQGTDAIGIISPYKAQVRKIQAKLQEIGGDTAKNVEVNTIDGFQVNMFVTVHVPAHVLQGREKDIIIFTTVRSSKHSVGFVADERRINVGLTRARCSLIVVANCTALARDGVWGSLLGHARGTGCMYATRRPYGPFLESVVKGTIKPEAAEDVPEVRVTTVDCWR